jgi:phosphoribosylformylglycinamidine (FGAM) synthase-like enzyme
VIVSVSPSQLESFETILRNQSVPFERIGVVTEQEVQVNQASWGNIQIWKTLYDQAIGARMSQTKA